MKFLSLLCLCGVAIAVNTQYTALHDVLNRSPVHTIRLTELQAKIEANGPMDQVGALCYQQMQEISMEISQIDSAHLKFQEDCDSNIIRWDSKNNALFDKHSTQVRKSSAAYNSWNSIRGNGELERRRRSREKGRKFIIQYEKRVKQSVAKRAKDKKIYDTDMQDFKQALIDLDGIKKVLVNSKAYDRTTSDNTARQGFLEAVENVQSQHFRFQTGRLTRAVNLLDVDESEDAPSGVDKIMNLVYKIRNELWAEMKKLTAIENEAITLHKTNLLKYADRINGLHFKRARDYIKMGQILSEIGRHMQKESKHNKKSSEITKTIDQLDIFIDFERDKCNAEKPLYTKMRSNKEDEVATLQTMIKVLRNLNWSGAVYNAIARISLGGVDENPEPGYNLGYQMDVTTGLLRNIYTIENRDVKDFGRVAIKLEIGSTWVWASFDSFHETAANYLIPTKASGLVNQRFVKNLVVHKSASANVQTGQSERGNVEVWSSEYAKKNANKIPGADDGAYDFGDERKLKGKDYGCFQIHDFQNKQTVLAVNNLLDGDKHDIGIGSQPITDQKQQPDWTNSHNFATHKKMKNRMTISWYFQPKSYKVSKKHATTKLNKNGKSIHDGKTGTTRKTGAVDTKSLAGK